VLLCMIAWGRERKSWAGVAEDRCKYYAARPCATHDACGGGGVGKGPPRGPFRSAQAIAGRVSFSRAICVLAILRSLPSFQEQSKSLSTQYLGTL
jgi:hypothetical protein